MDLSLLPHFNAVMNSLTIVMLVIARRAALQKRRKLHERLIGLALVSSGIFLTSYLVYHFNAGVSIRYDGTGWARSGYLLLLGSHTVLAALVPFGCIYAITLAARSKIQEHRKFVKVFWPLWLYVSVTGVMIYGVLYDKY